MSNTISTFLQQNPLLLKYTRSGLININALARYMKENIHHVDDSVTLPALGMELRRYIAKLPNMSETSINFSNYSLQIIARSNIEEIVLGKDVKNRIFCMDLVDKISKTKNFISLVEGERELVVMTDYQLKEFIAVSGNEFIHNTGLSLISINFPIELRVQPGIYSIITSSLAEAEISIHSFHTIGGEIIILVKDENLSKTQEIFQLLLNNS